MKENAMPCDVAIVGLGPTGATLANLLGVCGLSVVVIEREKEIHQMPRAVHFDDEVLRVFQTIGLAEQVEAKSPFNPGMRFVNSASELLLDWPRPPQVGEHLWRTSFHFHQPDLEEILRAGLKRFPQVQVVTGGNVAAINTMDDGVVLNVEICGESTQRSIAASYVVGCDGARSTVRGLIKSSIDDFGFRERWLVVDVLLDKAKPELGDYTIQYCNPHRPATYVRGPGNRRRWEITVHEDESDEEISAAESVWRLLAQWVDQSQAKIERTAVYTFHSMIASNWGSDRIFLAGDAAHQMPPFMGQGMCAGIRDVANLAWKLNASVQSASQTLLSAYQKERYPHVQAYIETAIRLGGLINACDSEEALRLAFKQPDGSAKMKTIAPRIGEAMFARDTAGFKTEFTGTLAPQALMADQRRLDDQIGYNSVLLVHSTLSDDASLQSAELCIVSSWQQPGVESILQRYQTKAVYIRPDRYVLGCADNACELAALIETSRVAGFHHQSVKPLGCPTH